MVNRRQLLKLSALSTASFAAPLAYSASKTTMTYNTGNSIGSTSPKDLHDNAQSLDCFVNGSNPSYPDRLGVLRKSWTGMEGEFGADQTRRESEFNADQAVRESTFTAFQVESGTAFDQAQAVRTEQFDRLMASSGYSLVGDYADSPLLIERYNQYVMKDGHPYRLSSLAAVPYTTTGDWATESDAFVLLGDDVLRQELADLQEGARKVAGAMQAYRAVDYPGWASGLYGTAIMAAMEACEAGGLGVVSVPGGVLPLDVPVRVLKNCIMDCAGRDKTIYEWNGDGPGVYYDPNSTGSVRHGCHAARNFTIRPGVPDENLNPNSVGLAISDTFGFELRDVGIFGYKLSDGLKLHNKAAWTEGTILDGVRISRCKRNLSFRREAMASDSFGYTTAKNVSLNALEDGQIAVSIGESGSTLPINIYNSDLLINIWNSGTSTGFDFAENAWISSSCGFMRCENPPEGAEYTGQFIRKAAPQNCGFKDFDGVIRTSHYSLGEDHQLKMRSLKYRNIRDIGEHRQGGLRSPVQWFRVAKIGATYSAFAGSVRVQCTEGLSAFRYANATFSFGAAGNAAGGYVPLFAVDGDGFNGNGDHFARFVLAKDAAGDHWLYFKRPAFSGLCVFEYEYERTFPAGQTIEYWDKSVDPVGIAGLTIVWDSVNKPAQSQYNGDEQVFTGQRGMISFNGNGTTTRFFVAHALGVIPEYFTAVATSTVAINGKIAQVTATSTDVVIDFVTAPVSGTGNIVVAVEYARKMFNNRFRPTT
jgi:hypothetical protein